jgi:[amino group carrier protein]-lysine/ornithine hydrolase
MDEAEVLERLVGRYSPSGSERAAVFEFVRIARELGYRARVDRVGNGIASRGAGRPETMFLGHIDTVEGQLPVRRASGRLHGRGAVDAKGPLAAALVAGAEFRGPGRFTVVAAVGEETDSRGARHLLARAAPDTLIAGEPSGWDGVTVGYKGELRIEATFRSTRTHYSSPFPTAADRAVDWVRTVRELAASRQGESPFRSLTAKVVGMWSQSPGDEEVARVTVDFRIPPGTSTADLVRLVAALPERPALAVTVRVEPVEVPRTNPVVLALEAGIRAEGARPTLWRKGGTSDLNLTVPRWNVPGAAYGPGEARLDHTAREAVRLRDLRRSVRVLRTALARLHAPG